MRIVLASALFPPDIAEPATYVRELAKRLATQHHVVLVIYGYLPEQVANVEMVVVNKRRPLLWRLARYVTALFNAARHADILYVQNGSSVELPATLVSFLTRTPLVVCMSDDHAHANAAQNLVRRIIERLALARAHLVIRHIPPPRPEILPLEPRPEEKLAAFEQSWNAHMQKLQVIFNKYEEK